MRLVDSYIDIIRFTRLKCRIIESENPEVDELHQQLRSLVDSCDEAARECGFQDSVIEQARFAVVSYVDEYIMCSDWLKKNEWQNQLLQRHYFDTTSAGAQFYDRLNNLNKHGPDREVREVYLLCLGLGFKGKFFMPEDRKLHEEAKHFNLSLLLPNEANQNIDKSILFSSAYTEQQLGDLNLTRRRDFMPYFVGVPVVSVTLFFMYFGWVLINKLDEIVHVVQ